MVGFALIPMVNDEPKRSAATSGTGIPIALSDCPAEFSIPADSVRKNRSAAAPIFVSLTTILFGIFLSPCLAVDSVKSLGHIPFPLACTGAESVALHADKRSFAPSTSFVALGGSPVLEHGIPRAVQFGRSLCATVQADGFHILFAPLPEAFTAAKVVREYGCWAVPENRSFTNVALKRNHVTIIALERGSLVAFSYQYGANPTVDFVRLLISDTQDTNHIFEDSEITMAYNIQAAQFQSGMFWSGTAGANLPATPVSYLRVAALLLDSLASNQSRLSGAIQILDVKLDLQKASQALRDQAKAYRATDDDAGAFAIVEQVNNEWSFRDRFWKSIQRQVSV